MERETWILVSLVVRLMRAVRRSGISEVWCRKKLERLVFQTYFPGRPGNTSKSNIQLDVPHIIRRGSASICSSISVRFLVGRTVGE